MGSSKSDNKERKKNLSEKVKEIVKQLKKESESSNSRISLDFYTKISIRLKGQQ